MPAMERRDDPAMDREGWQGMMICPSEIWTLARVLSDLDVNGQIDALSEPWRGMAAHLAGLSPVARNAAFQTMLAVVPERDELVKAVGDVDPNGPEPAEEQDPPIPAPEWVDPPGDTALHGLTGDIVRELEPHTEADPAGLLVQILLGYGNALGRGAYVRADGHNHFANEFAVLVGETSRARKGTAGRRANSILSGADPTWHGHRDNGGWSSGEGLINAVRDATWAIEKKTGKPIITDPGIDDKRFIANESEFGAVLRCLRRDGNTLSAVMRKAWDGDSLDSKVKGSPIKATHPHISMMGHITVEELLKYLEDVEVFNGFG